MKTEGAGGIRARRIRVHAIGALGAVHYIENHLPDLYREVKTRGFSLAVRATFDDNRATASELVTPIYRHEAI